ncbi:hypothetical protein DVH24_041018 [Malus domestica]|uniref:Uncharacterized protein n=1 Tax=Malus domestica TaxID=3750 RepID=A0A498IE75_MALDO|nr:hypothetical protein DVH24_041018 [Malus domestica]
MWDLTPEPVKDASPLWASSTPPRVGSLTCTHSSSPWTALCPLSNLRFPPHRGPNPLSRYLEIHNPVPKVSAICLWVYHQPRRRTPARAVEFEICWVISRPLFGAFGKASSAHSIAFAAVDNRVKDLYRRRLDKKVEAVCNVRKLSKLDMKLNDALPKIRSELFHVLVSFIVPMNHLSHMYFNSSLTNSNKHRKYVQIEQVIYFK